MKKIEVDGEIIYVKKSLGSWRVVHPIKRDLDQKLTWKNIDWFNFITGGSWKNLIWYAVLWVIIVFAIFSYFHDIQVYRNCFNNYEALEVCKNSFGNFSELNISNLTFLP